LYGSSTSQRIAGWMPSGAGMNLLCVFLINICVYSFSISDSHLMLVGGESFCLDRQIVSTSYSITLVLLRNHSIMPDKFCQGKLCAVP
jgi:hypothetical protein